MMAKLDFYPQALTQVSWLMCALFGKKLWLAKIEKIYDVTRLISVTDLSVSSGQKGI